MTADLLYREAPERAAQKAQDGIDTSDKNAKMVSKLPHNNTMIFSRQ